VNSKTQLIAYSWYNLSQHCNIGNFFALIKLHYNIKLVLVKRWRNCHVWYCFINSC